MLQVSAQIVKELRETTGAGVMDCKKALELAQGDKEKAISLLKEKGLAQAQAKAHRVTAQGLVDAYMHPGGRLGALVEVNCESDFVARTDAFKELAHNLAMQVAACAPLYLSRDDIPGGEQVNPEETCLLAQPFIKDPARTVGDLVAETAAQTGENVKVRRFVRFELGK